MKLKLPWLEYEKRYCLKQLLYSRFHEERVSQLLIRGNRSSGSSERNLLLRNLIFFFFYGVYFWDQGKEEKVIMLMIKSERHRKHFIYKTKSG